ESLPALIQHFNAPGESRIRASYLGRFFQEQMSEDSPTTKLLKAFNLSIMSTAFAIVRYHFSRYPVEDIGPAWKVNISIGQGDSSSTDHVIVTHSKAARSEDNKESFEFLWELKMFFDYEMK